MRGDEVADFFREEVRNKLEHHEECVIRRRDKTRGVSCRTQGGVQSRPSKCFGDAIKWDMCDMCKEGADGGDLHVKRLIVEERRQGREFNEGRGPRGHQVGEFEEANRASFIVRAWSKQMSAEKKGE